VQKLENQKKESVQDEHGEEEDMEEEKKEASILVSLQSTSQEYSAKHSPRLPPYP